ncbi:MAG TPA: MMPL family transporter, partial [Mycobacterium sp.]|nr:MMPL family transporter [Mycobacterium sp.]
VQGAFVVGTGLLLDTFLVRTITVPAIAVLVGRANWWPSEGWDRWPSRWRLRRAGPSRRASPSHDEEPTPVSTTDVISFSLHDGLRL